MSEPPGHAPMPGYSATARWFHWLTVALLVVTVPIGLYMTYRGDELNLWDRTTNTLYSTHKLVGITILALVVLRLCYRLAHGAPPDAPTLSTMQRVAAHVVHWSLYALLIGVALTGWLGVSMFPALDLFGLIKLPGLTSPDKAEAERMFEIHELLGDLLLFVAALHIAAALVHHFVLRDGVLERMWPRRHRT